MEAQTTLQTQKKSLSGILAGIAFLLAAGGAAIRFGIDLSHMLTMNPESYWFMGTVNMRLVPECLMIFCLLLAALLFLARPRHTAVLCIAAAGPIVLQAWMAGKYVDAMVSNLQYPEVFTMLAHLFRITSASFILLAWWALLALTGWGRKGGKGLWVIPAVLLALGIGAGSVTFAMLNVGYDILRGSFAWRAISVTLVNSLKHELLPLWVSAVPLLIAQALAGWYAAHPIKKPS